MQDWWAEFNSDPHVVRLNADSKSTPPDVIAKHIEAVRDHAPDAPYANKEFDKVLADGIAAVEAKASGDIGKLIEKFSDLRKHAAEWVSKVNGKFPRFTTTSGNPDSWINGQIGGLS